MEQTLQFNRTFDVVVLGAGTAGCAAALAAADEGKRVCVVEQLGGPGGSGSRDLRTDTVSFSHNHSLDLLSQNTGGGEAFSILPPYLAVYIWQRLS